MCRKNWFFDVSHLNETDYFIVGAAVLQSPKIETSQNYYFNHLSLDLVLTKNLIKNFYRFANGGFVNDRFANGGFANDRFTNDGFANDSFHLTNVR